MKKTLFFLIAAVSVSAVLSSCGGDGAPTSPEPTNTPNATQTAIAQQTAVVNLSKTSFTSVPGGTFTQQTDRNDDGDVLDTYESFSHTISAFKMGQYEVTYELWYMVYQWAISSGYTFANEGREGNNGTDGAVPTTAKHKPVTMINWRDVIVWCNAYSEMTDLTPCYTYSGSVIKDSRDTNAAACDGAVCDWSANGYRLPTEGEWQYAASYIDGTDWTPYNYVSGDTDPIDTSTTIGDYCWYFENSGLVMHDVGGKQPNDLGIYDMSGNAYEWCRDWFGLYPAGPETDYKGPDSLSDALESARIIRGGFFANEAGDEMLETGSRAWIEPYKEIESIGFRLARTQ